MNEDDEPILFCERRGVFAFFIFIGGFFGAYTFILKGGVFCNAQTANCVLFAISLGERNWSKAAYLLLPIFAYLLGAVVSEYAYKSERRKHHIFRFETEFILFESLITIIIGFIPDSYPVQICQVTINFIASMQYNTFRQADKIPMATTFCTNHIRQTGIYLVKLFQEPGNSNNKRRLNTHLSMLFSFILGGILSTICCLKFSSKAIWVSSLLLIILSVLLIHADLTEDKGNFAIPAHGH